MSEITEFMDSSPASPGLSVHGQKVNSQGCDVRMAQSALLTHEDNSVGIAESKAEQDQTAEAIILSQGTNKLQEMPSLANSQHLSLPSVNAGSQRPGPHLSSDNLHLTSPISGSQPSVYRPLAPRVHLTAPPQPVHKHSPSIALPPRPPAMVITDSGVKSALPSADVRLFWDNIARNARVLLECDGRDMIYDVKALMRKNSSDFFSWYEEEAGLIPAKTVLMLELLNINGQAVKTFRIYRGALTYFQLVKQSIWDIFWASFSSGESNHLSIYVSVPDDDRRCGAAEGFQIITEGMARQAATTSTLPIQTNYSNCTNESFPKSESSIYELLN